MTAALSQAKTLKALQFLAFVSPLGMVGNPRPQARKKYLPSQSDFLPKFSFRTEKCKCIGRINGTNPLLQSIFIDRCGTYRLTDEVCTVD